MAKKWSEIPRKSRAKKPKIPIAPVEERYVEELSDPRKHKPSTGDGGIKINVLTDLEEIKRDIAGHATRADFEAIRRDKARHTADEVYAQPEPVKSPAEPPAQVCSSDGSALRYIFGAPKRIYECQECHRQFVFMDKA